MIDGDLARKLGDAGVALGVMGIQWGRRPERLFTGLRASKALGLVWADVDVTKRRVLVRYQVRRGGQRTNPHRLLGHAKPAKHIKAGRGEEVLAVIAELRDGAFG